jgi:hypothetical protein
LALPPVFITRTIEATPFPLAPNVCVSFPHREDWWKRYPELHKARNGHKRTMDDLQLLYEYQKRSHRESVFKRLNRLKHWATCRAVFAELRNRRAYSVHIFPFAFLPSIDGDGRDWLGETDPLFIPQTRRERAHGIKPRGTQFQMRGVCWASEDKSNATDVFYSDERCEESDADGVLLHELVHAMRKISGLDHATVMGGSYGNSEEFHANTIQMIYRSERGQAIHDYAYHPIDQASVLKRPQARALITALCHKQMSLCIALSQVDTPFNPIRAIAEKLFRIDL